MQQQKANSNMYFKNSQEPLYSMTNIENFPLRSGMPTFTISIQHYTGCSSKCNKTNKKIKSIRIEKEWIKLALLTNDMTVDLEYPKESTNF